MTQEEYLLTIDFPYMMIICGIVVFAVIFKIASIINNHYENMNTDSVGVKFVIPFGGIAIIGIFTISIFTHISQSKKEQFIANVWNAHISNREIPNLNILSISDELTIPRLKITLINGEVYYAPYTMVDYKTIRFSKILKKDMNQEVDSEKKDF